MKKLTSVLILLMCLLTLAASMLSGCRTPGAFSYRQVSQEQAVQIMQEQTGYIIIDVRTEEEYDEGHIPGAVNLPLDNIGTVAPPQLPDKDQLILVYCRSGRRSKQAAQKLADQGYTNIVEFGGINTWEGEIVTGDE